VDLGTDSGKKEVKIGTGMTTPIREELMALLKNYQDIFAQDMPGLSSDSIGHGVGAVLVSPDNQCIPFTARLGFDCTNNMAEYEACALAVQAAIDSNVKLLKVYGDSALVIHQLRGE